MPASWRSGFSRPAPPITSENPDNPTHDALFARPSRAHSPAVSRSSTASSGSASGSRSLSSSSSAYSLLSKKMAQQRDDGDDGMSIRSSRTVTGGRSGDGSETPGDAAKGRGRAASRASSVLTTREPRESSALVEEDEIEPMDLDSAPASGQVDSSAKGKERAADSPSSLSVKRQRLRSPTSSDPKLEPRRRPSTVQFNNPGSVSSPPMPTLATMTAEDLMPRMRTTKSNRPASARSGASSTHLMNSKNSPAAVTAKAASNPPVGSTINDGQRAEPGVSDENGSTDSSSGPQAVPTSEVAESFPPPTTAPQAASRSWFSLLSGPKPAIPSSETSPGASGLRPITPPRPATPEVQTPTPPRESDATPPAATPAEATGEPADETSPSDKEIVTAGPAKANTAPLTWREWAWSTRRTNGVESQQHQLEDEQNVDATPAAAAIPAEAGTFNSRGAESDSESTVVASSEQLQSEPTPGATPQKGWLGTWWGANGATEMTGTALAAQRKREAWVLKLAADRAAGNRAIEAPPSAEQGEAANESARVESTSTSPPDASHASTAASSSVPQPQPLRKKASESWNALSRSIAASSVGLSGISPSKSLLSLRVPFSGLGATNGSSAASTRSRESSHATGTAPSSPQLLPQSDVGPVKPLTGSIRSSAPRRAESIFEPSPPVENLVLPTFGDTFLRPPRSFAPKRSTLTRAVSVVSAYLFQRHPSEETPISPTLANARQLTGIDGKDMPVEMKNDPAERLPKALEVMGEAPRLEKVKRVVTIGIHGWFTSSNMVKSVLGEQTGTSVKFATMMHDAVHSFLEDRELGAFNIQAIALEGQGEVEDRIDKLYDQLVAKKEWLQAIRMADAVFFATHSQGAVVTTQLIARLLDQDLLRGPQAHLLAMCGITQGPFIYLYQSLALAPYFNWVESAPARELFDFQNPESVAAIKFLEALRIILHAGVKITTIGSLNDQVVPLYSALFSGVSHPGILRAVYIDSDAFRTSDFLANLIVFSIRLRNAGLSDHDLVYHVSEALAGALTGVGHSKIYEEENVYKLAVRYHFETTHVTEAPTYLDVRADAPSLSMSFNPRDRRNPYLLTWALRGIIEDPQVRELFGNELLALREAYETWRPQTKVLKDVKLKLEGIRMMNWKSGKL